MITEEEKIKLKSILGSFYSQKVYNRLLKTGKRNPDGTIIKKSWIRVVFNGQREQPDIEEAIYYVAAEEKKLKEKLQQKRNQFLK